jgi:plastocyanin
MRRSFWKRWGIWGFFAGMMILSGCAGLQAPVQISRGQSPLLIKAGDFNFEPNNIRLPEPGTLSLKVENISGTAHNLTIKNPEGQILNSTDLPPRATVSVEVTLPTPGTYEMVCNKPFHTTMGMKGQIIVGK